MKKFINSLSEEKLLCSTGHTLGIAQFKNKIYAYRGFPFFERIDLLVCDGIGSLELKGTVLGNRRWAIPYVCEDTMYLFCTSSRGYESTIYTYQDIILYKSNDGKIFTDGVIIADGSAPWIAKFDNKVYYFYYHTVTDSTHYIHVRGGADTLEGAVNSPTNTLIKMEKGAIGNTLSAPSVIKFGGMYHMLCEYMSSKDTWKTEMFISRYPDKNFVYYDTLLSDYRACAFQYILNGTYYLLYSRFIEGSGWDLRYKKGLL
jgi:hypothetical protein